ncbi:hypothetical protein M0Q97_08935 [Candidatus Dojkabacteria bacterium]|nr:hypothetical protein [Candidatus Dojkabacteria bacterium]
MKDYNSFIMNENSKYGTKNVKIIELLKKIEKIFDYEIEFSKFKGKKLDVQLEVGKGYSSNGWTINGTWIGDKLKIKDVVWDKDSYTNISSKVVNKRSSYKNYKPKEFQLVDALIETGLKNLELTIYQELD